jgi:hypothetical protein
MPSVYSLAKPRCTFGHPDCQGADNPPAPEGDARDGIGYLARDKFLAAQRAFMIEKYAGRSGTARSSPDNSPSSNGQRAGLPRKGFSGKTGVEFTLWDRLNFSIKLRCRSLVELNLRVDGSDGLKKMQRPDTTHHGGGNRLIKRNANEALCRQIKDALWYSALKQALTGTRIGQVKFNKLSGYDGRQRPIPSGAKSLPERLRRKVPKTLYPSSSICSVK